MTDFAVVGNTSVTNVGSTDTVLNLTGSDLSFNGSALATSKPSGLANFPIKVVTSNYTINASADCIVIVQGSSITITLPDATTCANQMFMVLNGNDIDYGSGFRNGVWGYRLTGQTPFTLAANGSQTINGQSLTSGVWGNTGPSIPSNFADAYAKDFGYGAGNIVANANGAPASGFYAAPTPQNWQLVSDGSNWWNLQNNLNVAKFVYSGSNGPCNNTYPQLVGGENVFVDSSWQGLIYN